VKDKKKLFLLLIIVLIIIIIVVVVIFTFKPKQKADILDTVSSVDTQPKLSITTVPATTTPATTAPATTTTQPPSVFQGSVTGDWSGQVADEPPFDIAGTFSVAIDAKGDVSGAFEGAYSGTIKGQVDLNGNLSAVGTASVGGASYVISWKGKLSVSGNSLSTNGDLSAPFISGKFSGKGTTSD